LGNVDARPHLVLGTNYAEDPAFKFAPMIGFAPRTRVPFARVSSSRFAEVLHDHPLELQYHNLDRTAKYKVRIVYGSESPTMIRLVANGKYEVQPSVQKRMDALPQEFDVPRDATATGDLRLTWSRPPGSGGTGRGVQVAEVWLIRVP